MTALYVFDAGAVLAVVDRDEELARVLFDASAHGERVVVLVTCLLEAVVAIDAMGQPRSRLLTLLRAPVLQIFPTPDRDGALLTAVADRIGNDALAHAGIAAMVHACRLFTTRAADLWPLGMADWQPVPV